ncbi:COG4705 family protein [Nocardia sp. NBC_00403]|uniref:COG4705 family protein n=1 Tax=Nocardia sp. NBC_00403 TaxID=2975990 RepID=UPI002E23DAA6
MVNNTARSLLVDYKLPQVTVMFWVLKIAATTLGETGGDLLAQTLGLGYAQASLLFLAIFIVGVLVQLRVRRFHPALYWTVIAATSTAGTTMSDLINRGPGSDTSTDGGLGYGVGAIILISGLVTVFVIWKFSGQTFDVANITTVRGEVLYWAAILLSNTLGTSLGDYLSDSSGLGYWGSAMLIAVIMVVISAAHYFTGLSGVLLFWMAFVLTRPLGATAGDWLSKPHASGGLALGTYGTSAALLAILVLGITYSYRKNRRTMVIEPSDVESALINGSDTTSETSGSRR